MLKYILGKIVYDSLNDSNPPPAFKKVVKAKTGKVTTIPKKKTPKKAVQDPYKTLTDIREKRKLKFNYFYKDGSGE